MIVPAPAPAHGGSGGSGSGNGTGGPSTGTGGPSTGTGQPNPNDPNAPDAYTGDGCYDQYGRPIKPWNDPCYEPKKRRATRHAARTPIHLFAFTRHAQLPDGVNYLRLRLGPKTLRTLARRAHHGRVRVVVYVVLTRPHATPIIRLHWITIRLPHRRAHRRHR